MINGKQTLIFVSILVMFADSQSNSTTSDKLYLCLHNCALCVRQWEPGLYNGEKCARKCLKHRSNPRIVDPDCDSLKMFNRRAFKRRSPTKLQK